MRRRALLVAVTSVTGVAGCLGERSPAEPATPASTSTTTPLTRTAEGVTATFRVVDGRAPVDDTAAATFEAERVIVTGTMDPSGCDRPIPTEVGFDPDDGAVRLVVGGNSPYETADVECGNASFDYRCVVSVDRGEPESVVVVHDSGDGSERFVIERGAGAETATG